jgi:hypothetical protein
MEKKMFSLKCMNKDMKCQTPAQKQTDNNENIIVKQIVSLVLFGLKTKSK